MTLAQLAEKKRRDDGGELEKIDVEEGVVDAEHGCDKSEQDVVDADQFWQEAFDEEELAEQLSQAVAYCAAMREKKGGERSTAFQRRG